jgi:ADP-ribosyl-[dinitrogen reductase] hydrolase
MDTNRLLLDDLFDRELIRLARSSIFDSAPPTLPDDLDWGRVEGMMLGLAIGDALGNTTEGKLPGDRQRLHGEIRDYLPNRYAAGGVPSDDTQLAFWTLEQLLADADALASALREGIGSAKAFGFGLLSLARPEG